MKTTRLTLLAALALGASAVISSSVTGCEIIASVDHAALEGAGGTGVGGQNMGGAGGTGAQGGAGGTTSSSGGGGSGGCMTPADCVDPMPGNECIEASCANNTCGSTTLADGTPIATQAAGDCKETQCAAMGSTTMVVNADDPFDDTKECTVDACDNGVPTHTAKPLGTTCAQNGIVCDDNGDCVPCNTTPDCNDVTKICQMQQCVPDTCGDNMMNGMETATDCGGPDCNPCGNLLPCLIDTDCQSLVCEGNPLICQIPTCTDDMTNGTETGLNCGGPSCPTCGTGQTCATGADCTSGVCSGAPLTCKAPMCGDGVANGGEACDGADLDGATCTTQGFAGGGVLNCAGGTCVFDTTQCKECDANNDCMAPQPVCDVGAGNCEVCVGADVTGCGPMETCDGNNDCDCGPSPSSSTGPACTGTTNPNCDQTLGCICAAAGAACGAGETCVAGVGCLCGDTVGATGPACGGGTATCTGGVGGVCDCNGAMAGGTCGPKESCEGGQCDCGPTTAAGGAQACPDAGSSPECFPTTGCGCGTAGTVCGANETCSLVTGGACTCGPDSNPTGEACADAQYPTCSAGVGCVCDTAPDSCFGGFVCAGGECTCDGNNDCVNVNGMCMGGACSCSAGACPIPGQICNGANVCTCAGGSCDD